jgi:hypothetical protein
MEWQDLKKLMMQTIPRIVESFNANAIYGQEADRWKNRPRVVLIIMGGEGGFCRDLFGDQSRDIYNFWCQLEVLQMADLHF